ncbi:uncharacterized protein EAE98_000281 [Botrytis deweyae]|uniref:NWD NACHT-NTPase N-terminal domain-containing protein n=1 Tax=Botrytis deweyae TaxID=2478750 RepID=A0ABQ7J281_9HELO|nr:uncharacterized protein EAE98_000281 [Botrytis deweyae]KAF7940154.1 hypothetical protein EAE98_000281 [Botrytis deweyae]
MASFSRASTLIGEDNLASKKGENELVGENDSVPNLWHQAYERLGENEKEGLKFTQHNGQLNFTEQSSTLVQMVIERKEECEKRQWKLYTKKNGDRIMVRDLFVKISEWINKFKEVGDAAVQYDPGHAALPWAAVRFFLQVAINDSQIYCGMISSIEEVSRIIALYTELEMRVLVRQSVQTRLLSDAVVRLYTAILRFLIQAYNYYGKRTLTRVLESSLKGAKSVLVEPNLAIEDLEHKAYELVRLVQHECLTASLDGIIANLAQNNKGPKLSNEDRRRPLQNRHEGTCEWVLKLEDFEAWATPQIPQGKLLWLHGPPGFGKTFMSARIIEHLVERDQGPVAYFFCVAENQQTRDPYYILKSWLSQLLEQDETMISLMEAVLANRTGKD